MIFSIKSIFSYLRCTGSWLGCCICFWLRPQHRNAPGCAQRSTWLHAEHPGSACLSVASPHPGKPTEKHNTCRFNKTLPTWCQQTSINSLYTLPIAFDLFLYSLKVYFLLHLTYSRKNSRITSKHDGSYLVFNFREHSAGPVKEVLSKSHFVIVVFITPFADSSVFPLLKPFIVNHGEYCHAGFSCRNEQQVTTLNLCGLSVLC